MKLSILICHLPERKAMLDELMDCLDSQLTDDVEVIVDAGPGSIGEKRNRLMASSKGEYIAFVDDDDMVSANYVKLVLQAIDVFHPDVVGMRGVLVEGTHMGGVFEHSIRNKGWKNDNPTGARWTRPANHLSPIKRSIAIQCKFPEINVGEDKSFSDQVSPLLHSEKMIETPIYLYTHRQK